MPRAPKVQASSIDGWTFGEKAVYRPRVLQHGQLPSAPAMLKILSSQSVRQRSSQPSMPVRSPMQSQPNSLPSGVGGAQPGAEDSPHRILTVDSGWRIASVHPDAATLLAGDDRPSAKLVGITLWEAFPTLVGSAAEPRLRRAMQHRAADDFELYYPSTGKRIELRARPRWPALSVHLREIAPAAAPSANSRSATEQPQVMEIAPAPQANLACAFDRAARLTHASIALLERWGLRLADAKGKTVLELAYPQAIAERLHRHIQRVITTGEPVSDEMVYPIRGGRAEPYEHIFSPLLGEDGTVHGVAGSIRILPNKPATPAAVPASATVAPDISDEVQRAKVLGEIAADVVSTEPVRMPLSAVFDRIAAAIGADCYFHHQVNAARSRLQLAHSAGCSRDELAELTDLMFGEQLPGTVAQEQRPVILHHLQSSRSPEGAALRALGMDACAGHPLNAGDQLLGTLVFGTRWRPRFEEEEIRFMQSAAALIAARLSGDAAVAVSERSAAAASRTEVVKEEFLNAVVQELRVPLESTLLQIRALASQPNLPEELRYELDTIARNLTTESRLVNDLLDLSRMARGELSIERTLVNLHGLLRDALASVKHELADHGLVLAMSLPDVAPLVRGDAVRLQQVFWNLLKRAIRSTPRGGVVSVGLSLTPALTAAIVITDSGVGLAPDQAQRVFEPWSAPPTEGGEASTQEPSGFGMATVRKIVELHDGEVRTSTPESGHGTVFTVELPLAEENHIGPAPTEAGHASSERTRSLDLRPRRILLVEDQSATRDALLVLLRQWQHEVIVAASVREARGLAIQHPFDLVISAVSLSDGSGYELMAALRLDHGLSGIALIGNGTEQDAALGRSAGFVARLSKPVSIEALEKALAAALPAD